MNNSTWFEHPVVRRVLSLLAALVIVAGICPIVTVQAETQYGYVNYEDVRFRRQANSTVVWTLLDEGWVVEIRGTKSSGGVKYYYVVSNIPKYPNREYYGYISKEYITLMTDEQVNDWLAKGGNAGEFTVTEDTPDDDTPAVMTNYARPNNNSTNYYSFDGSTLTSQGLLSASEAYYVAGSSTIGSIAYYVIVVDSVNCYVPADSMTMLTTDDTDADDDAPVTAPEGHVGVIRLIGKSTTNLRSSAAMKSTNLIRKVPYGEEMPYYGTQKNGSQTWYKVFDVETAKEGYVLSTYVKVVSTVESDEKTTATPKPDASETAIGKVKVTRDDTNIRKKPETNKNNVVTQADKGDILPYYATSVESGDRWYYVYVAEKDAFGYVRGDCVSIVKDTSVTPTPEPEEETTVGYVVLTSGGVNLRKKASVDSSRLGQFDKGDVYPYFETTKKNGVTWYKVITEKGIGYFHGDYCTPSDSSGNIIGSKEEAENTGYVVTTIKDLWLRKKADSDAGVHGKIKKKGTLLEIVGDMVKNDGYKWYKVKYDGDTGYVRGDCVTVLTDEEAEAYKESGTLPTPTPSPTPKPKPTSYIITTVDNVWIRKSPSTKAGTAGQVKEGTVFKFSASTKVSGAVWYTIKYNGETRYIKGSCVEVMTDAEYNEYLAALPTPTPTPSPTPEPDPSTLSDIALTVMEKVIVRKEGKSTGKQLALIYREGTECTLKGKTTKDDKGNKWYYLKVNGTTGWIRGDLIRVLTKTEAEMYEKLGDPDAKPEASYTTLQIGSTGDAVTTLQTRLAALGYLTSTQITGVYDTNTKKAIEKFQKDNDLTEDGIAGSLTQHALFGTVETGYYDKNNGSSTSVKLYKPELIDWYTGGIQKIFYKGAVATLTDVRTGISFKIKRWSGAHHADVEPLTAADTAAMCRIYKVDDAQEISDKNYYQRRPVLITIGGHSYCASMFGMPHNYPAGDTISGNDFYGQFCVHFTNSQLHDGKGVDKRSSKNGYFCHADAIAEAYKDAVKKLNIK